MANYCATTRSNYFRVKDAAAFKRWCSDLNLEFWTKTFDGHPGHTFYAISADTGDCCGWPTSRWDDEQDDSIDIDFAAELSALLDPRDVAVIFEIGAIRLRYVNGYATAVHPDGHTHTHSLDDIYHRAADAFGAHVNITEGTY